MIRIFHTIIILLIFQPAFSQNIPQSAQTSLNALENGLMQSDFELVQPHLSENFKVGGYDGESAKQIVPQLMDVYPPLISLNVSSFENSIAQVVFKFDEQVQSEVEFDSAGKILRIQYLDDLMAGAQVQETTEEEGSPLIDSFTTSFELVGNLIYVKAMLNGKEEYFILDTGAKGLTLNSRYFNTSETGDSTMGISGGVNVEKVQIESFDWNGIKMEGVEVEAIDISHLEEVEGRPFKGLIGYDVLKNYEVLFDYKQKELTVFSAGNSTYHSSIKPIDEVDFSFVSHLPVVELIIGERTFYFGIDSGASINLIGSTEYEQLHEKSYKEKGSVGVSGIGKNGLSESLMLKVKKCVISNQDFKKKMFVTTNIETLASQCGKESNIPLNGLIGYPILSERRVSIDYVNQKIFFW